jgi:hypothetical protein
MELAYQKKDLEQAMEQGTDVSLWCLPGSIIYKKSEVVFLDDKSLALLERFGKSAVFPAILSFCEKKGRGVIAARIIKKN